MAQLAENSGVNLAESRTSNSVKAISLISAHGLEHMYGRSFLVLIPAICRAGNGPNPGGDARRGSAAFQRHNQHERRVLCRHIPVSSRPSAVAQLGYDRDWVLPSLGRPNPQPDSSRVGIGISGQRLVAPFGARAIGPAVSPASRIFISLHRSAGNVGDWVGPLVVGALLVLLATRSDAWRIIMGVGTSILIILILIFLRNIGGPKAGPVNFASKFGL